MRPTDAQPLAWIDRILASVARIAHRQPWKVLAVTLCVLAASWLAASRLQVRGDFLDLLPERSEGARLFRHAMARMGGGSATLFVVVRSPDADANKRLVDALEPGLRALPRTLIRTVEHGPEEARRFYMARRWLFAEVGDLEEVECELARARRRAQPGFIDLDDEPCSEHRSDRATRPTAQPTQAAPAPTPAASENARPFERFRDQLSARMREVDRYPTGYFRTDDGGIYLLVIRASGAGFGDRAGDELVARVNAIVARVRPASFHPRAEVGLGGDVANAIAERDSLLSEAALSTGTAFVLILLAIAVFFRSPWALGHIGLAMFTGVGMAYAVAYLAFGYLTMSTAFLGSIVAGNGINYAILYLARYRERRTAGDDVEAALVDASVTCRAGTQLASLAAAGAYGSLMLTGFRGFSQFGLIGASGMLFCWTGCMVIVPASVTLVERLRGRLTKGGAAATSASMSTPITGLVGTFTARFAPFILAVGAVAVIAAAVKLPGYLRDPWEYNFAKLQSSGSRHTGADAWSSEADKVFRAGTPAPTAATPARAPSPDDASGYSDMILADRMDDALAIAEAVKLRDQQRTGGRYVHHVETAWDILGGPPPVMARKLALLNELRAHIDAMMPHLEGRDLETAREWRPPENLHAVAPEELPSLVRERFSERDGTFGTPVFVHYRARYSPSDGRALMVVSGITQNVRLTDGRVVPTASRATVFAEMIRSMEIDGPRATLGALTTVILVVILATRRLRASLAVLGALLSGIVLTVGGAAWLDTRLNFLNFVALPLTFGIGVEYAINLYDRMRYTNDDPSAALRSVGGAVTLCSLTTIIGYGALLVADNQALQSFGRYAMAGEVACLVTAMLLLPSALKLLRRAPTEDSH
ncbi:MAG: MMPL family transporter [Polyangiales bacterium]